MAVYVDDMRRSAQLTGRLAKWSHLMADTTLGLRSSWLQHAGTHREHYDVTETVRQKALTLGACPVRYPHGTGKILARKRELLGFDR